MSEPVSTQVSELQKQLQDSLARLNALVENRSAWVDGIEGCREGIVLLNQVKERLQAINEDACKQESDLASARAQIERWSKMHSELSAVERDLRAECDRLRDAYADLSDTERNLRAESEKKDATLKKQATSLANVNLLAVEMIREMT